MEDPVFYPLQFVGFRPELGTIKTLAFQAPETLRFQAGQWLHLAAAPRPQDRSLVRHMSMASAPSDPELEFTMDLGSTSAFKQTLGRLRPGDEVTAFKIKGEFTVDPRRDRPVVFLAGGLGITPIRSILRDLDFHQSSLGWSLVHVSRGGWLFHDELTRLPGRQWRCTRPGFADTWAELQTTLDGREDFYLCGSQRFLEGMVQQLRAAGIDEKHLVAENFH